MNRPNPKKLQEQCDEYNAKHPIGSTVRYHTVIGEQAATTYQTRTAAQVLSGHTAVVWLENFSGCVSLDALTG